MSQAILASFTRVALFGVGALLLGVGVARAQAPLYPYDTSAPIVPAAAVVEDPASDAPSAPAAPTQPTPPLYSAPPPRYPAPYQPPAQYPSPYPAPYPSAYPAPYPPPYPSTVYAPPAPYAPLPAAYGGYPPPPGWAQPAAPGYYYPPPGYAPPMYSYPPPAPQRRLTPPLTHRTSCMRGNCRVNDAPARKVAGRARYLSIGLRLTTLGINQSIGGQNVILGGGGVEIRLRTAGRFGLEAGIDFLHGDFTLNGPITRDSYPFNLSALLYIFPNTDDRHFNMYFLGGGGIISTHMGLNDPRGATATQDFYEWSVHGGLGFEVRFHWFALRADGRMLGMWRDDRYGAGALYGDVDGAPIPKSSIGGQGTLGLNIWF